MKHPLLGKVLHLPHFHFVCVGLHELVALTLTDCVWMWLKKLDWRMLIDPVFFTLIDATIFKVLQLAVVRVVLKGHRRMEHLDHFARLWELQVLLSVLGL